MPLAEKALLKKVKKHELKALKGNTALLSHISALDDRLEAAYNIRCPEPYDYGNRRDLIRIFNVISREIYGTEMASPVVVEFGSFLMNMFSSDSDLDLSINFNNRAVELSKKERVKTLRKFANKLYTLQSRGIVKNVELVPRARVPVLKVTDCGTDIECDFSVENRDGIVKSSFVFLIAAIDERFRKLSIMLKAWAKAQGINSSKEGTLNSISLISLAAFHLQHTNPPILPPFSAIFTDGFDLPSVGKNVSSFMNYGEKNRDSLAQLFVTLLIRLRSVETLWAEGLCASIYEGSWICKTFLDRNYSISVEDFTDRSENVARAVGPKQFIEIYQCIEKSLSHIKDFVDGKIEGQKLDELLFGPGGPRVTKRIMNHDYHDPTPTKRRRLAVKKEGTSSPSKGSRIKRKKRAAKGSRINQKGGAPKGSRINQKGGAPSPSEGSRMNQNEGAPPPSEGSRANQKEGAPSPSEDSRSNQREGAPSPSEGSRINQKEGAPSPSEGSRINTMPLKPICDGKEGGPSPSEGNRFNQKEGTPSPSKGSGINRKEGTPSPSKGSGISHKEGAPSPSKGSKIDRHGISFGSKTVGTSHGHGRMVQRAETFGWRGTYATQNPSTIMQRARGISMHERSDPLVEHYSSQSIVGYHPPPSYHQLNHSSQQFVRDHHALPHPPSYHRLNHSSQQCVRYPHALPNLPLNPPSQSFGNLPLNPPSQSFGNLPLNPPSQSIGLAPTLPNLWRNPSSRPVIEFPPALPNPPMTQHWGPVGHLPRIPHAPYPGQVNNTSMWSYNPSEAPRGAYRPY